MAKRDYKVGYGKPPKHSQFKQGQSGNPKGRKKGSKGIKTDLRAQLITKVSVTENGQRKDLRMQEVILKTLAAKAAKGDVRAIELITSLTMQMFGIEDERKGKSILSASDQSILDDYLESMVTSQGSDNKHADDGVEALPADDEQANTEGRADEHENNAIADDLGKDDLET